MSSNMPIGFQKLVASFDPRNLNLMPAADVIKALSLLRDSIATLERIHRCTKSPFDCELTGISNAQAMDKIANEWISDILNRYKDWE